MPQKDKGYVNPEISPRSERNRKHHQAKKNHRGCFFWGLLVTVIALIVGGKYAYAKYTNAKKAANTIFQSSNVQKARDVNSTLKDGHPVSVLLMGTDTGALGRDFKGRTDTIMVAVLNPKKKTMTVVSLPRVAQELRSRPFKIISTSRLIFTQQSTWAALSG